MKITLYSYLMLSLLALGACERDQDSSPDAATPAAPAQTSARELAAQRERADAFGLPLPPRVLTIKRSKYRVTLTTDMSLAELELFFRKALPDHEVFRVSGTVTAVPLRDTLPRIKAKRSHGPLYPREVTYDITPDIKDTVQVYMATPSKSKDPRRDLKEARVISTTKAPTPGMPVTTRTASGALLAPGAVWGEPYTPPPNSPLHSERNRYNFGRPYGDWVAD